MQDIRTVNVFQSSKQLIQKELNMIIGQGLWRLYYFI